MYKNSIGIGVAAALVGLGAMSAGVPGFAQGSSAAAPSSQGDDGALIARVKNALHSNQTLDDRHIKVEVQNGEVVLSGFVQSNRGLLEAGRVAEKAAGNHKIVNNLRIEQEYRNGRGG